LDGIEREILNLIQSRFPVSERPYLDLANVLGIREDEAFARIERLRENGVIRRLGGVFDSRRLGYFSTLCAAKVPQAKIELLSDRLSQIPGVTHNYLRNHSYNMWFTLIAPTTQAAEDTLESLKEYSGIKDIYSLPALKVFKIKVEFDVNGLGTGSELGFPNTEFLVPDQNVRVDCTPGMFKPLDERYEVSEKEISLIKILQEDLPHTLTPFADIACQLNWSQEEVLHLTQELIRCNVIRRFGAVLRHQKAGFTANVMGVWQVEHERVIEVGKIMAQFKEVTHCYERPTLPEWPYNLFTMIHGRSAAECEKIMNHISRAVNVTTFSMLYSLKELKKSSMKYFTES